MSRRTRPGRRGRRPVTPADRGRFIARLAAETGQTPEQVAQHLRQAVDAGWLIETRHGWQAALPADVAPADWTGPVT